MFSKPDVTVARAMVRSSSKYKILLSCAMTVLMLGARLSAQTSVEAIHVITRTVTAAKQGIGKSHLSSVVTSFKTSANLVTVPVSVTDKSNRIVLGLEKQNFQVYENKQLQTVHSCSTENAPVSIGIVLDTSGSMQDKLDEAREAIDNFIRTANSNDEFFMITFSDSPVQALDFDSSAEALQNALLYTVAKGSTALFDAVYLAIRKMESAKNPRKAILIISDGGDNHSHYTEREVRRIAR